MIGRRGHDLEIDQHGQTRRGIRAIAAAEAKHQAGAPDAAATLLAMTETGPQDEPTRARLSLLRGRMAFRAGRPAQFAGGCIVRHIIPVKISSLMM